MAWLDLAIPDSGAFVCLGRSAAAAGLGEPVSAHRAADSVRHSDHSAELVEPGQLVHGDLALDGSELRGSGAQRARPGRRGTAFRSLSLRQRPRGCADHIPQRGRRCRRPAVECGLASRHVLRLAAGAPLTGSAKCLPAIAKHNAPVIPALVAGIHLPASLPVWSQRPRPQQDPFNPADRWIPVTSTGMTPERALTGTQARTHTKLLRRGSGGLFRLEAAVGFDRMAVLSLGGGDPATLRFLGASSLLQTFAGRDSRGALARLSLRQGCGEAERQNGAGQASDWKTNTHHNPPVSAMAEVLWIWPRAEICQVRKNIYTGETAQSMACSSRSSPQNSSPSAAMKLGAPKMPRAAAWAV